MARASRQNPQTRRESILDAAIDLSKTRGYNRITRDEVATRAGVSSPLIGTYFPRMADLRKAVIQAAISREIVEVIAQGLTINDNHAIELNEELRFKVMTYLSKLK